MNTTAHDTGARSTAPQVWAHLGEQLRERRRDRSAHRALERELASYTTSADVNDLLAAVQAQDSGDADEIRSILARNQQERSFTHRLVS